MMQRLLLAAAGFLLFLGTGTAAQALSIDCTTAGCLGGSYTLDVVEIGLDTYEATYTVDTSGVFSVDATLLNEVEFKVANDYQNISILSGPDGTALGGALSGRGCQGNNGTFVCIDLAPDLRVGDSYTWTLSFESSGLIGEDEWHVGARYTSPDHNRGWVISESADPIPEPGAALLFGAGLLVASHATRRAR